MNICVFGAGSIGCYVGGRLAASGSAITFIGRPRIGQELQSHGLSLTDYRGAKLAVSSDAISFSESPAAATNADLILVTVKSAGTDDAGLALAPYLKPNAVVVSLQNGLGNADILARHLPQHTVLKGMVPFNVLHRGQGAFHQGSEGELEIESHLVLSPFLPDFQRAELPLQLRTNMLAIQWAKLLLNLNNPINALAGIPLKAELSQRAYRRCVALAQREGLEMLDAAGIQPAKLTALPPHWLPDLLSVPDLLFKLLANRFLAIDPLARSSMWEDLEAGRTTEVDWINGEIIRLAATLGRVAPVNAKLVALIRAAEQGGRRDWSGAELLAELTRGHT
jgi:2-dehydropantoate 2-reductase